MIIIFIFINNYLLCMDLRILPHPAWGSPGFWYPKVDSYGFNSKRGADVFIWMYLKGTVCPQKHIVGIFISSNL